MQLSGQQLIGNFTSKEGKEVFSAINPTTGKYLPTDFHEATLPEVNKAVEMAEQAFLVYRKKSGQEKAAFLDQIGEEILALGEALISRCAEETGLPEGRLQGERGRTINQLKLFAALLREGTWVGARIDTAIPDRQPLPKPDIRQMKIALGPVGIFGASNFPLAFSVAGGDTASALAAGCSVVIKAHPAHPGTSEMVAKAILEAAKKCGMPEGVFSLIQGASVEVGMALVKHPLIKAIGFTGSFKGGKALFNAAAVDREEPIPVYAEMGSTNPVFILPKAIKERGNEIARGLVNSVTMGVGQFCTNPGVVVALESEESKDFIKEAGKLLSETNSAPMLTGNIQNAFEKGINNFIGTEGVSILAQGKSSENKGEGTAYLLHTTAVTFLQNKNLSEEVFGPSSLAISASQKEELIALAEGLHGHLTATILATQEDLEEYKDLIMILERKVGRLLINGFPTGVEVCHSMVHGGPYPATTDSKTTSVGTAAIERFVRMICYQDFPENILPQELKNINSLNIWRMVNGNLTKENI
jgi:NADP-dependent aldehyde dehydrogenase